MRGGSSFRQSFHLRELSTAPRLDPQVSQRSFANSHERIQRKQSQDKSQQSLRLHKAKADSFFTTSALSKETSLNYEIHMKLVDEVENAKLSANIGFISERNLLGRRPSILNEQVRYMSHDIELIEVDSKVRYELVKGKFHYFKLRIQDKKPPAAILFQPNEQCGFKPRLFVSAKIQRPNRFNCELEIEGQKVNYSSPDQRPFSSEFLYVSLLSNETVMMTPKVKFGPVVKQPKQPTALPSVDADEEYFESRLRYTYYQTGMARTQIPVRKIPSKTSMLELDKEFKHQITVKSRKKMLDLVQEVEKKQKYHQTEVRQILYGMQREISQRRSKIQTIQQLWIIATSATLQLMPILRMKLQQGRQQYAQRCRRQFIQRVTLHQFFKRQLKRGTTVRQRLMLDMNYSFKLIIFEMKAGTKRRLGHVVSDFMVQFGYLNNVIKNTNKILDRLRNIVKKWKLFRKYKLEFRGRVKYNISFAIREIYEFLRLSRDEAALAQQLFKQRQQYLQEQKQMMQKGRRSIGSNRNLDLMKQQKRNAIQDQAMSQFMEGDFLLSLAIQYIKRHHARWNDAMTVYRENRLHQLAQRRPAMKMLLDESQLPHLFTEVDWLLVVQVVRDELLRRGLLMQSGT